MDRETKEVVYIKVFTSTFILTVFFIYLVGTNWSSCVPSSISLGFLIFSNFKRDLKEIKNYEELKTSAKNNFFASLVGLGGIFLAQLILCSRLSYSLELFSGTIFLWMLAIGLSFVLATELNSKKIKPAKLND